MPHETVWPVWIALDLLFAGLSAGALAASLVGRFLGERYRDVTRWGAYLAPWPVIAGLMLLIYDLDSPARFWYLLVHINPRSVMSNGTFLLAVFSFVSVGYFVHTLYEDRKLSFTPVPRWGLTLIQYLGLPMAIAVGTYTAFLLNASIAITLWNNGVLPLIFLASALATGSAAVTIGVALSRRFDEVAGQVTNLGIVTGVFLALQMFALAAYMWGLHVGGNAQQEALRVLSTDWGFTFYGGVWLIGMVAPLLVLVFGGRDRSALKPVLTGAMVLAGGLFLRLAIVLGGQAASPLY